jgi:hypothetical protein
MASGIIHTVKAMRSSSGASRMTPNCTSSSGFERRQSSCSIRAIVKLFLHSICQRCWANDNPTAVTVHTLNKAVMRSDSAVTCHC